MNISRQIALGAGLAQEASAYTINMVCGSGLRSVCLAAQSIQLGAAQIVAAGGVESMSGSGFLSLDSRWGVRMGNATLVDVMLCDGLTDAFGGGHMGCTAENIAKRYSISREEQDTFAAASQLKAEASIAAGKFVSEIVPVAVPQKKQTVDFLVDEYPRAGTTVESLSALRPAFDTAGTVTAGNASGINDGAAMVVLCSERALQQYGLTAMAEITGFAAGGVAPEVMGLGPTVAVPAALAQAGRRVADLNCIESNEAFAVQALAVGRELGFDDAIVNSWGGAIALGHPIGASGARILVTLVHRILERGGGIGLGMGWRPDGILTPLLV
jgi:acetyl-CoA C-acetyltransferase